MCLLMHMQNKYFLIKFWKVHVNSNYRILRHELQYHSNKEKACLLFQVCSEYVVHIDNFFVSFQSQRRKNQSGDQRDKRGKQKSVCVCMCMWSSIPFHVTIQDIISKCDITMIVPVVLPVPECWKSNTDRFMLSQTSRSFSQASFASQNCFNIYNLFLDAVEYKAFMVLFRCMSVG